MSKFTLICDNSYDLDTHVVSHTFTAEHIADVLMNLDLFLKGVGYVYDGQVDIVEDEPCCHSPQYFDTERNR